MLLIYLYLIYVFLIYICKPLSNDFFLYHLWNYCLCLYFYRVFMFYRIIFKRLCFPWEPNFSFSYMLFIFDMVNIILAFLLWLISKVLQNCDLKSYSQYLPLWINWQIFSAPTHGISLRMFHNIWKEYIFNFWKDKDLWKCFLWPNTLISQLGLLFFS